MNVLWFPIGLLLYMLDRLSDLITGFSGWLADVLPAADDWAREIDRALNTREPK